jgi:hypothetical protein
MTALKYLAQIALMAFAFLSLLFAIDWLSRSILADILAWAFFLVGPALLLKWALK